MATSLYSRMVDDQHARNIKALSDQTGLSVERIERLGIYDKRESPDAAMTIAKMVLSKINTSTGTIVRATN
jgi:hypothetical protein